MNYGAAAAAATACMALMTRCKEIKVRAKRKIFIYFFEIFTRYFRELVFFYFMPPSRPWDSGRRPTDAQSKRHPNEITCRAPRLSGNLLCQTGFPSLPPPSTLARPPPVVARYKKKTSCLCPQLFLSVNPWATWGNERATRNCSQVFFNSLSLLKCLNKFRFFINILFVEKKVWVWN